MNRNKENIYIRNKIIRISYYDLFNKPLLNIATRKKNTAKKRKKMLFKIFRKRIFKLCKFRASVN